jgi:hypothetical protein
MPNNKNKQVNKPTMPNPSHKRPYLAMLYFPIS